MQRSAFDKNKIKILLLEGIDKSAEDTFRESGYTQVETLKGALEPDELIEKLQGVHFVGIRSRTQLNKEVLSRVDKLKCIGCFCIGTNQVDLNFAKELGIPVFNAPFSNTRSVAELVLAEIIFLFRGIHEKSFSAHNGGWLKSAEGSHEVRGKTLGIVGYGHIGTQLGVLAESLGMKVIYYDIEKKLSIGNATAIKHIRDLFQKADIVSLHVPQTKDTKNMIDTTLLSIMKKGSYLINASRGNVVVIEDLVDVLNTGILAGAALDVFPKEPKSKTDEFISPLRGHKNVILTPHIGGSTLEAQQNIGYEVAQKIVTFSDNGSTLGSVNFPQISLPVLHGHTRFIHVHKNIPGILNRVNEVFSKNNLNIASQYLQTNDMIGYIVMDVETDFTESILSELRQILGTLYARILY